jgi:drug/metabolite transporter (DMT)-like permease
MSMPRILFFVVLYAATSATGDAMLSVGMKRHALSLIVPSLAFFAAGYGIFLGLLKDLPCSVVVPAQAGNYVVTVTICHLLLGESVPLLRWLGTLLISTGVSMILLSDHLLRQAVRDTHAVLDEPAPTVPATGLVSDPSQP